MIIAVVNDNKIKKNILPEQKNGNYQIIDVNQTIIGYIITDGKDWYFNSNTQFDIFSNGQTTNQIKIDDLSSFDIKDKMTHKTMTIYAYPTLVPASAEVQTKKRELVIGKSTSADISFAVPNMKNNHAKLIYDNNKWYVESIEDYIFVNDQLVKKKNFEHGDILFIAGLRIFCISNIVVVTSLIKGATLNLSQDAFDTTQIRPQQMNENFMAVETELEVFNKDEEFSRSPRFRTFVEPVNVEIAAPPADETKNNVKPFILTIGPRITMILTSVVSMFTTLMTVANGNATIGNVLPGIILSVVTLVSAFLWPALTRKWTAKEKRKATIKRTKMYRKYLERKEKEISELVEKEKQIILENNISLEECQQIIYQKKRNLWERKISDNDFLNVRLGVGFVKPQVNINYKQQDFQIDDNLLEEELLDLIKKYEYLEDTPLNTSLVENRISAVVGNQGLLKSFFEAIMLQIVTLHMFSELKIVILTDENNVNNWNYMKFAPHCWDNQKEFRLIGATIEEKKKISAYLEGIIKNRKEAAGSSGSNETDGLYKKFGQYYLVIVDGIKNAGKLEFINEILNSPINLGFSVLIKNNRINNLPSQCSTFVNISQEKSGLFKTNLSHSNQLQFDAEFNKKIDVAACIQKLANIYVDIPKEAHELPKSVGFLEMYGVGNVEQFNSINRWEMNNPVNSLSVPVGIDQQGELFYFDIHEKVHGPHGLVAGTTGSGKSEWIITYILSLCVNFSPLEVQFVLIDYKGGGLAGSFVNEETGMRLPHLVGTITNLDKSEIRRSLASLDAESKRRQRMFNEARDKLNDSSMNIYKYQQYYRKGMLDEPLSHLFIISDEFAELKAQEPEFLEQLVSIARIGRSLGIHLILATQKPSGVVNEQMWSNSRFKVCLRVQSAGDSNEMLKCPDAAYLHQTGAFYLQVGLNEVFELGQSAYSGGLYKPTNVVKKKIDTAVEVLSRDGNVIDTIEEKVEEKLPDNVHGEELLNVIMYVMEQAKLKNYNARRLWLDAMPATIFSDNLKTKYSFTRTPFEINPIIGEYDNPYQQKQEVLRLNLNKGNTFLTGQSGSGKEQLLQSMIYSIITNYTPQEVSLYVADLGAETLAMFENAPHVGDIIYSSEKEKLENLVRYARKTYIERRKKYREFGGNYESYIKYSETKDPLVVIVINAMENLKENYSDLYEDLCLLYAESAKYGIIYVVSSTEKQAIRSKYMTGFPQKLVLNVADGDASDLLGKNARGINIRDYKGRGLTEVNGGIYEFQAASIYPEDKLRQVINTICDKLNEAYKFKTKPIPMIPRTINSKVIDMSKVSFNKIVAGYRVETIEPYYVDFDKNFATLVLASKKQDLTEFAKVMLGEMEEKANDEQRVYLFDQEDLLKSMRYSNIKYVGSEEIINTYQNLIIYTKGEKEKFDAMEDKREYKPARKPLLVFFNASSTFKLLGKEQLPILEKLVETSRELGLFDFVILDNANSFKDISREKYMTKLFLDSNGIMIGNCFENQSTVELLSRDIRFRDAIPEGRGYIVEKGKAYYSQLLQYTETEVEEEE